MVSVSTPPVPKISLGDSGLQQKNVFELNGSCAGLEMLSASAGSVNAAFRRSPILSVHETRLEKCHSQPNADGKPSQTWHAHFETQ